MIMKQLGNSRQNNKVKKKEQNLSKLIMAHFIDLNIKQTKKYNFSRIKVKRKQFSGLSTRPRFLVTKLRPIKRKIDI